MSVIFSKIRKSGRRRPYDVIVIGSGSGLYIVEKAVSRGLKTALVSSEPIAGTCLNVGCVPSKLLIGAADGVMAVREAIKFGISAQIEHVDFAGVMDHMRRTVEKDNTRIRSTLENDRRFDFFSARGRFVDNNRVQVGNDLVLEGKQIFLAVGARAAIPSVQNLETTSYLTSDTVLNLDTLPAKLLIIGGGFVAAEYAHFFDAMGSEVTILQSAPRLLPNEEADLGWALESALKERMDIHTDTTAQKVEGNPEGGYTVTAVHNPDSHRTEHTCRHVLVAAGRRPNTDGLGLEYTGIQTDAKGFIRVDEYMETTQSGAWGLGDVTGLDMFTPAAYAQAEIAWQNAMGGKKVAYDEIVPHTVFTSPQIASVGLTSQKAKAEVDSLLVGIARYSDVVAGLAMRETRGFVKFLVDGNTDAIVGCHIIGSHAAILIQEVVNAMAVGATIHALAAAIHIHPALNEVLLRAIDNLKPIALDEGNA